MPETFDYTTDFQDLIISSMIKHPEKFTRFGPILEPRFFLGVQATITAQCALSSYTERGRFPSWETLEQMVVNQQKKLGGDDEDGRDRASSYITRLRELDTGDVDFVVEQVISFARERATLAAIKANIADIQEGKIDGEFIKRIEEALRVGQDLENLGYILHRDAEAVVRKITSHSYGIRTGYHLFDEVLKHGLSPGWLTVFLAPPKRYKTAVLLNMAINMISQSIGENVFYYSCEISQELALARVLFNLTDLNQAAMYENPERFIDTAKEQINMTVAGHLLIKGFGSKTARILDIKNHAKTVINQLGIIPKAIFIDYAETVAHSDRNQSEHQQSASVYTEMRAMGHELGVPIITADRCNKETVSLAVPNMTSFQGAFQKAGIVDLAIGLCATEAEHINNIIRAFFFEYRHGPAYQHFRGKVDPDVMRIEFDEKIKYEPEEEGKKKKYRRKADDSVDSEFAPYSDSGIKEVIRGQ